jgi:alcohol dehydrogenase class IV
MFPDVRIEPTDRSVLEAAAFLKEGDFDGVVSVGGGSVMDTAKGALVYAQHPASFETYFPPPVGAGKPVPGPLKPHVACPTTSGTGSEVTGLSVIRFEQLNTKFVLGSRDILPNEAIIDPACIDTLRSTVVASTGFDLLSHAIECYTARAYTRWATVARPGARPMIQGANPWSDLHAREALRIVGGYLERGVADAADHEARDNLCWAATLAGMAFGNSGTHLPHALSYAVSQMARDFRPPDYPGSGTFVPHGLSVIVNSPAVFRYTAQAAPERHLEAAQYLGAHTSDALPADAGEVVAARIITLMRAAGAPNGLGAVGLTRDDAGALADSAARQRRAIGNAPRDTQVDEIRTIFEGAVAYW